MKRNVQCYVEHSPTRDGLFGTVRNHYSFNIDEQISDSQALDLIIEFFLKVKDRNVEIIKIV